MHGRTMLFALTVCAMLGACAALDEQTAPVAGPDAAQTVELAARSTWRNSPYQLLFIHQSAPSGDGLATLIVQSVNEQANLSIAPEPPPTPAGVQQ